MATITAADRKCAALPYYKPHRKPTRNSDKPTGDALPFDWRSTLPSRNPETVAKAHLTRLKGHRKLTVTLRGDRICTVGTERMLEATWQGEYPDAPPSGMGPCAPSSWTEPKAGAYCLLPGECEKYDPTTRTFSRTPDPVSGFYPVERVA